MNAQDLYEQAVDQYGQERADRAAAISIEYYNDNALAGFSLELCEAEQSAAFKEALNREEN
jgi:hypothetical protein